MAKRKNKKKSGSLKSQTIVTLAASACIILLVIIGIKVGLVGWLLNLIFLILLTGALVVNMIMIYKLNDSHEVKASSINQSVVSKTHGNQLSEIDNNNIDSLKSRNSILEDRSKTQSEIIIKLKEKIASLEEELLKAKSEKLIPKVDRTPIQESTHPEESTYVPDVKSTPRSTSLFFDGPYDDRLFSDINAASEKRFRYVYRIEYGIAEPSVGKLYLEPTTAEYDILRSFSDTVLKPACNFDNAFYSSFSSINQLSPGIVHKQGNDWVVKEKVRIKFN